MTPVRFHHLKAVARAPQLGRFVLGGGEAHEETRSIETGGGLHAVLFNNKKVVFYPKARNDAHAEFKAFKSQNPGALILTRSEYDLAHAMVDAVLANADASALLEDCPFVEQTIQFDWMGRACRTTPDARGHNRVIELKQSKTAHPQEFPRLMERMFYPEQVAYHRIGAAETSLEERDREGFIIAVEPTPPHLVCVFEVGPRMLARAERRLAQWMELLLGCEGSQTWPGYSNGVVKVDLPESDHPSLEAA